MRKLEEFCCQHTSCPSYGQRSAGNLRWHGWSSKKKLNRENGRFFVQRKSEAVLRLLRGEDLEILSRE